MKFSVDTSVIVDGVCGNVIVVWASAGICTIIGSDGMKKNVLCWRRVDVCIGALSSFTEQGLSRFILIIGRLVVTEVVMAMIGGGAGGGGA